MKKVISILVVCTLLYSCEKNITFKLNNVESTLVVDATIENDQRPQIILTKSFDYFSNVNATLLAESFVHDAEVSIFDGISTQQLKEFSYPIGGIRIYYYSTDISNPFRGTVNTSYNLIIKSNEKKYTATTTIPFIAKSIDTLFWRPAPYAKDSNNVVL